MSFISDLLFPPKCIICGELIKRLPTDRPFCPVCAAKWEFEKRNCREAAGGQPIAAYSSSAAENEAYGFAMYAVPYVPGKRNLIQNKFILHLKNKRDRLCTDFAARELYAMLNTQSGLFAKGGTYNSSTVVTWIPRSYSALRRSGHDHMKAVAKRLAKMLSVKSRGCIGRSRFSAEQKQLSGEERMLNARRGLHISPRLKLDGKTVVLIDDITTVGASLEAASQLLIGAGAKQIIAMTLAKTVHPER